MPPDPWGASQWEESPTGLYDPARGASANDDALRFMESLTSADESLAADLLDAEVDALLGRASRPKIHAKDRSTRLDFREPDEDNDVDFGWYNYLLDHSPALDEARTVEAARQVEAGLLASDLIESLRQPSPVSLAYGQIKLTALGTLRDLIEEGEEAWKYLVLSNLRLVFHWSKGVARSIDPDWAQDAFQVGVIGLMRGLQGWDYKMGYKLSTFVSWHIRQAIQRWRANDIVLIRLPVHVWEQLNNAPQTLSPELAARVRRSQDLASIEAMIERNEDEGWDGGLEALERSIDVDRALQSFLSLLSEREESVLSMRYGVGADDPQPMTLDEIGAAYSLTRERIRQIEGKALTKLRLSKERRRLARWL